MKKNFIKSAIALCLLAAIFTVFAVQALAVTWNAWTNWDSEITCSYARAAVTVTYIDKPYAYVYCTVMTNSTYRESIAERYYSYREGTSYGSWLPVEYPSDRLPLAGIVDSGIVW